MDRRGFLGSILALGAAPAIVRADSLMKVTPRIWTRADGLDFSDWLGPCNEGAIVHPDGGIGRLVRVNVLWDDGRRNVQRAFEALANGEQVYYPDGSLVEQKVLPSGVRSVYIRAGEYFVGPGPGVDDLVFWGVKA